MRFKPGHVLYGSRRTYLRKVAIADFEGITANTTYVLEPINPEVLLPGLLPFIMQTEAFTQHSVRESKGSVNPYVNFSDLAWFEFALPPPEEQRRLVEVLSSANTAWADSEKLVESLNTLIASFARELIMRLEHSGLGVSAGIDALGLNSEPSLKTGPFGTKLKTSYFQKAGRSVVTIGSIAETGLDPSELFFLSEERAQEFRDYECLPGDIVFSRVADVGRCHVIQEQETGYIISSNLIRIRINPDRVRPKYLWLMLRYSDGLRKQVARVTTQAAGRLLVNTKTLSTLQFFLPNLADQDELLTQVEALENLRDESVHRRDKLRRFRSRLAGVTLESVMT